MSNTHEVHKTIDYSEQFINKINITDFVVPKELLPENDYDLPYHYSKSKPFVENKSIILMFGHNKSPKSHSFESGILHRYLETNPDKRILANLSVIPEISRNFMLSNLTNHLNEKLSEHIIVTIDKIDYLVINYDLMKKHRPILNWVVLAFQGMNETRITANAHSPFEEFYICDFIEPIDYSI